MEGGIIMSKGCREADTPFKKYSSHHLETIQVSPLLCVWSCTASNLGVFFDCYIISSGVAACGELRIPGLYMPCKYTHAHSWQQLSLWPQSPMKADGAVVKLQQSE